MSTLTINGVSMPEPAYKGIKWSLQAVDYDAGRTMDGTMHRNMVAQKRKLSITWPPMAPASVRTVLNAVNGSTFQVVAFDFLDGANKEMTMYVGDRTIPYMSDALGLCDSFTISLVEV